MKKYGCIGKKLTHSFSKEIHAKLADYSYELIELGEDDIKPFFTEKNFEAIIILDDGNGIPIQGSSIDLRAFVNILNRFLEENKPKQVKFLFVAHRKEILEQSIKKFRAVLKDHNFGELMVDGLGIFDAGSVVINDRNKLADDGVIILGVTIDSETKEIVAGPDVQTRGLVFIKESDHLVKDIASLYIDVVKSTFNNPKLDVNEKRVAIRDKVSKYVKKETGKDPMVLSMVVEI